MPDMKNAGLLRLSGHIGGVNWRPTRFVDCVPSANVCGLCRTIPKGTVQLPCAHFLCESCLGGSRHNGVALCPLDREPFEEKECQRIHFPVRKGNSMKAHCWNEEHGCEFVGTMEAVLCHYEDDCLFHAVECPLCERKVHHKDLPVHYIAGCIAKETPSPNTERPHKQDSVLTIHDVNAALEEVKVLLSDPHHDHILAIQSQINELVELSRIQAAQLADIVASERAPCESNHPVQAAQIADGLHCALTQPPQPLTAPLQQSSEAQNEGTAFERCSEKIIPWSQEKQLILRKLEVVAGAAFRATEQLPHSAQPHAHLPVLCCDRIYDYFNPNAEQTVSTALPKQHFPSATYRLTLRDGGDLLKTINRREIIFAEVTTCHRRDTYFTVAVRIIPCDFKPGSTCLEAEVRAHGLLQKSRLPIPVDMVLLNGQSSQNVSMFKADHSHFGEQGIARKFWREHDSARYKGFLENGKMTMKLVVQDGLMQAPNNTS
ncbi:hypothetical protein V5799_007255 [Amblyomma americanum]|uniref:RING-type domain-containing protein n=1 Tax=Amblyomma americanum TaxID=6943 RepID=A0AAQ4DU27_AMBAM